MQVSPDALEGHEHRPFLFDGHEVCDGMAVDGDAQPLALLYAA